MKPAERTTCGNSKPFPNRIFDVSFASPWTDRVYLTAHSLAAGD